MRILPRFGLPLAILILFLPLYGQGLPSSVRAQKNSGSEVDNPRVRQIMETAEQHYKLGELNLKDKNIDAARAEFTKALDSVLESGIDVRSNSKLQTFYLQLVERVYRMEVAMPPVQPLNNQRPPQFSARSGMENGQQPGFLREQKFEPSPLDELSHLELSPDRKAVSPAGTECSSIKYEQIKLRGLNLGMKLGEVKNRIPLLKLDKVDAFGRRRGSIYFNDNSAGTSEFRGVKGMAFTFIDNQVTYIGIIYDDSIRWNGLDEFVGRTAEALALPKNWEGSYGTSRTLTCNNFQIVAEFLYPYSERTPLLRLTDLAASSSYIKRVLGAAEKRRLEEEKKRQAFKP